jgi:hypothetical protein
VNDDGLAGGGRDAELGQEGGVLDFGRGIFDVVIVEADLADGDRARVSGEGD